MRRLKNMNYRQIMYIIIAQIIAFTLMLVLVVHLEIWKDEFVIYDVYFLMLILLILVSINYFIHLFEFIDFQGVKLRRQQISNELMPVLGRIRRTQHEYAHIIIGLQFDVNIPEKLSKYTKDDTYIERFFEHSPTVVTSIYNKLLKAENYGINGEVQFILDHEDLWQSIVSNYEIVEIITNLVDNSIEALDKIKGALGRKIRIQLIDNKDKLEIVVGNSHNTLYKELLITGIKEGYTTKKDSTNHGYGLFTVNEICQKYGGNIEIDIQKEISSIRVSIPRQKQETI